ncbi:MAG: acetyl-CoA carboxylase biotin carboxyl carrier protein subunit [Pseudonocardiales bacterium]|nr:MAG: acetyl-CoA carboxylase biotin carboxyl carrier protein subunit [Pseudonocardiales bacterium]
MTLTAEPTTQTAVLAEVCRHTTRLLSDMDAPPRSLHVRVGMVAVDIEWSESQQTGTHQQPPRSERAEAAIPAPDDTAGTALRPVLTAQAVGVFHRRPEPGADPFVVEGDVVAAGQQVGIIEVMKLMLPVVAEQTGRIVEVLKGDGEPVHYGEPLFALAEAE